MTTLLLTSGITLLIIAIVLYYVAKSLAKEERYALAIRICKNIPNMLVVCDNAIYNNNYIKPIKLTDYDL